MDASVDDVRVANGFDVGQSFSDVNGDVVPGRRAVLGQGGCEPVRGFDRDVAVVLPAFEEDFRPMGEVLGVGDGVQLGVEPAAVSSGGSLVNEVALLASRWRMPGRVQSGVDPMAATRPTRWSIPASAIEISTPIEKPPATNQIG